MIDNSKVVKIVIRMIVGSFIVIAGLLSQSFVLTLFILTNEVNANCIKELATFSLVPILFLVVGTLIIFKGDKLDD